MNSTSCANGAGSRTMSSRGVSVVPRMVLPIQGTQKSTRPSAVLGTIRPWLPGRKLRSTTRCTPWLGATIGGRAALPASRSMLRTASTQTPVALTTQRARTVCCAPVSASCATSPRTWPFSRSSDTTGMWLSINAPRPAAVRARATARRASSNWPSQYLTPPRRPARRAVGSSASVPAADSHSVAPRPRAPASASYRVRPMP